MEGIGPPPNHYTCSKILKQMKKVTNKSKEIKIK